MKYIKNIDIHITTNWDKFESLNKIEFLDSNYEEVEVNLDGDIYSFSVFSEEYWEKVKKGDSHPLKYGFVILANISKDELKKYIFTLIKDIEQKVVSYNELSKELSKIWFWEYDNYTPNKG